MKIVHSPDMVAHLWANQSQESARTTTRNFFFLNKVLFSYGDHYVVAAHLENGRILWNDGSRSNTTSRHSAHAWRALTGNKTAGRLHVPCLNYDQLRDLQRLQLSGGGKTLPALARICANQIIDTVQGMAKMRHGAGPMRAAFQKARGLQTSGLELCAYVAKGKRIPKWPLPMLPDDLPADKPAVAALIKSIAKGQMIDCHRGAILTARQNLSNIGQAIDVGGWAVQNIRGSIATIQRGLSDAQRWHETAHGRKSRDVRDVLAELALIEPRALAVVQVWETNQARKEIREILKSFYKSRRVVRDTNCHLETRYYAGKFKNAVGKLTGPEHDTWMPTLARLERCADWQTSTDALKSAQHDMGTAEGYELAHPADALRCYRDALKQIRYTTLHPQFASLHAGELERITATAQARIESLRIEVLAKHARAVADWKAGITSRLPYEAGTFARVRGALVETSRGATVPLLHACRLARITRRVIAAGGASWVDGAGPMVGSFRVQRIGADGSAIIGCHDFDATEVTRILLILENCADCIHVTEELAA